MSRAQSPESAFRTTHRQETSDNGRPTVRDIAHACGVSPAAVSFALNDKPGVAEPTRRRIIAVAAELGWRPGVGTTRASAVGLVISGTSTDQASDRFHFQFLVGLQTVLQQHGLSLVLERSASLEEEAAVYRRWAAQRRVDGVIVMDPRDDDPRPATLCRLGLPAVAMGGVVPGMPSMQCSDQEDMSALVAHLVARGYRRLAYVAESVVSSRVQQKTDALRVIAESRGLEMFAPQGAGTLDSAGMLATERLLGGPRPPDVVVYDHEFLTQGGVIAVQAAGLRIGADVGVVSCEETPWCRMSTPSITVTRYAGYDTGGETAAALVQLLDGAEWVDQLLSPIDLIPRQSTQR